VTQVFHAFSVTRVTVFEHWLQSRRISNWPNRENDLLTSSFIHPGGNGIAAFNASSWHEYPEVSVYTTSSCGMLLACMDVMWLWFSSVAVLTIDDCFDAYIES